MDNYILCQYKILLVLLNHYEGLISADFLKEDLFVFLFIDLNLSEISCLPLDQIPYGHCYEYPVSLRNVSSCKLVVNAKFY